jgi:hypothetical protein
MRVDPHPAPPVVSGAGLTACLPQDVVAPGALGGHLWVDRRK